MQEKLDLQMKEREDELDRRMQIRQHDLDVRQRLVEDKMSAIEKLLAQSGINLQNGNGNGKWKLLSLYFCFANNKYTMFLLSICIVVDNEYYFCGSSMYWDFFDLICEFILIYAVFI